MYFAWPNNGYATYRSLPLRLQATCTLSMAWLARQIIGSWNGTCRNMVLEFCHSVTWCIPAGKLVGHSARRNRLKRTSTFITWYVDKMWLFDSDLFVFTYLFSDCAMLQFPSHTTLPVVCYLLLNNLISLSWYEQQLIVPALPLSCLIPRIFFTNTANLGMAAQEWG